MRDEVSSEGTAAVVFICGKRVTKRSGHGGSAW